MIIRIVAVVKMGFLNWTELKNNWWLTCFWWHFSARFPLVFCLFVIRLVSRYIVENRKKALSVHPWKVKPNDLLQKSLLGNLFKGHSGYLFTVDDMLVFLWCQVAPYLFVHECKPVSPQLTVFMYRYPLESFQKEQKHHMLAWLWGQHMILSVLFSDWSFKLWTLSLAALCLHLAMSRLVPAVFSRRVDFEKQKALRWLWPPLLSACFYLSSSLFPF